jgi:phosphatidylglycerophosphatase A
MKKGLTAIPRRPATWLAMLGIAGFAPVAPATAGSALTVLVGWFLPVPGLPLALALLAVGTVIAVWCAGEAEQELGHDAGPIVVDEAVGQSITLLFCPHRLSAFLVAFALFRIFDIYKPPIADRAQDLPGGLGIVADDVVAGVVALLVLQGLLWAQAQMGWTLI